jgi:hypothetical protein
LVFVFREFLTAPISVRAATLSNFFWSSSVPSSLASGIDADCCATAGAASANDNAAINNVSRVFSSDTSDIV